MRPSRPSQLWHSTRPGRSAAGRNHYFMRLRTVSLRRTAAEGPLLTDPSRPLVGVVSTLSLMRRSESYQVTPVDGGTRGARCPGLSHKQVLLVERAYKAGNVIVHRVRPRGKLSGHAARAPAIDGAASRSRARAHSVQRGCMPRVHVARGSATSKY